MISEHIDWSRLIDRLDPPLDGETPIRHRTGVVDAVNGDGTLDILISGVVVPDVATMQAAPVGAVVQLLAWRGDLLALGVVGGPIWQDWTPQLTNLTLGNGTVVARYIEVGKLVVARFEFTLGSSSAVGSGPTISTPVTAAAITAGVEPAVGPATLVETGVASYQAEVRLRTVNQLQPRIGNTSGAHLVSNNLAATVPFTWGTGDIITFTAIYEGA